MGASIDDWLVELAAPGKGGLANDGQPVVVHAPRIQGFALAVPLPADFTGATMRGEVRRWPDSAEDDDPLAEFGCANGGYSGGVTMFAVSLTPGEVAALPAAAPRASHVDFVFDLWLTPAGATEEMLLGGIFRVLGTATGEQG